MSGIVEIMFWGAFAVIFYTYIGYPVLLVFLSAIFAKTAVRASRPTWPVTVIIVAHNEEKVIEEKLKSCLAQDYEGALTTVVIADGSTDGTVAVVSKFREQGVISMARAERSGKAVCLNYAIDRCETEYIVFTDARQRLHSSAVRLLMENFGDSRVGAVSGELQFVDAETDFSEGISTYWAVEKKIRELESSFSSTVGVTGALYAARKSLLSPLPPNLILDDVWVPMKVLESGHRVVFERAALAYDRPSQNAQVERRRKVRTLAGNYQLVQLWPQLLSPISNSIWLQFVSHKMLRLLSPLMLVVIAVSSLLLITRHWGWLVFVGLQAVFYLVAISGAVVSAFEKNKIVRSASVFLTLNWFALLGAMEFVRNKKAHLW